MRKACLTISCWPQIGNGSYAHPGLKNSGQRCYKGWCWKFLADTSICNFCWCCKVKQMPHILSVIVIMPQLMAKKQIVFFLLATLMVDFTIKVIKLLDNNMNLIRKKKLNFSIRLLFWMCQSCCHALVLGQLHRKKCYI